MNLDELRTHIDRIDHDIIDKLAQRSRVVAQIAQVKQNLGIEPLQPARFEAIMHDRRHHARTMGVDEQLVSELWDVLHESSVRQQQVAVS